MFSSAEPKRRGAGRAPSIRARQAPLCSLLASFRCDSAIGADAIDLVAADRIALLLETGQRSPRRVREPAGCGDHLIECGALIAHDQSGQLLLLARWLQRSCRCSDLGV